MGKITFSTFEVKPQFCCAEDVRMIQSTSIKLCPTTLKLPLCAFKMSLSPKLLMEVVAARFGIGGKRFPGVSYLVGRRGPAA